MDRDAWMDEDYCRHEIRVFEREARQYLLGVWLFGFGLLWWYSDQLSSGENTILGLLIAALGFAFREIGHAKTIPYRLRLIEIRNQIKSRQREADLWGE